ncbi:hypothetical protein N7540_000289 [Penicillium herquei]|nr:hypothetical protein N7540_000289 [Penicillium herquei]
MPTNRKNNSENLSYNEVIATLRTLPGEQVFGHVEDTQQLDFLRRIYRPLHKLFSTSSSISKVNCERVKNIKRLQIPQTLQDRFSQFERNPLEFWEMLIESLPRYSDKAEQHRAKLFLQSAAHLEKNFDEQMILRRLVAISSYKLFRRAIPTSDKRIMKPSVKKFLSHVGLSFSEKDIETFSGILHRGQRQNNFCKELAAQASDDKLETARSNCSEDDNHIYGPLFFSSIPDSM